MRVAALEQVYCRRGGALEPAGHARVEHRLAAILAADVAGYSRLIEVDEEGTLGRLRALRPEVIDSMIAGRRAVAGRVVKTTGDGLLVKFASVVDALHCASDGVGSRPAAVGTDQRRQRRRCQISHGGTFQASGGSAEGLCDGGPSKGRCRHDKGAQLASNRRRQEGGRRNV
jgi:class 3 adenylate cyclase